MSYFTVFSAIDTNKASLDALLNGQAQLGFEFVSMTPIVLPGRMAQLVLVFKKDDPVLITVKAPSTPSPAPKKPTGTRNAKTKNTQSK